MEKKFITEQEAAEILCSNSSIEDLPQLKGTEKQVNWARDIRDNFIRNISEAEALLQWWEENSSKQEEHAACLRANAKEGKSGAVGEYNRFDGNVSALALTIGERIHSLNAMVHEEGLAPARLSEEGRRLEHEYGYQMRRYKPRSHYTSDKAYSSAIERRKKQKDAAMEIIANARSYVRQEQSASKWIDKREYAKKRKVKVSGSEILWDEK